MRRAKVTGALWPLAGGAVHTPRFTLGQGLCLGGTSAQRLLGAGCVWRGGCGGEGGREEQEPMGEEQEPRREEQEPGQKFCS